MSIEALAIPLPLCQYFLSLPQGEDMRRIFSVAIIGCVWLVSSTVIASAQEAAIAYCAASDTVAVAGGGPLDHVIGAARFNCRASGAPAGCCTEIRTTRDAFGCIAFAGKNPDEGTGFGTNEKMATDMAITNCRSDCLGYNSGGVPKGPECLPGCKVRAAICR